MSFFFVFRGGEFDIRDNLIIILIVVLVDYQLFVNFL